MADPLDVYRDRRDFGVTPEPDGDAGAPAGPPRFVIQEHRARSMHWDLRFERDGVLVSFAVPRGVPRDPDRNNLAVRTEDHPLSYIDFAGEIPAGQYGAGGVTIYDAGTYEAEKFRDEELIVVLHGERVRGRYALFHTDGANWLIHRMDPPQDPGRAPLPEGIEPMLAKASDLPRDDSGWAFEIKWDGVRALAYVSGGRIRLSSRRRLDITAAYPELRELGRELGVTEVVLDGEIVAFDEQGRPSFGLLQKRMNLQSDSVVRRAAQSTPVVYQLFDLLFLDGHSTLDVPYRDRRRLLDGLELDGSHWKTPAYHAGDGAALLAAARAQSLEGIVGKRLEAPYEPGRRSGAWIKVKSQLRIECEIGGFTYGEGGRTGRIGALAVGVREADGSLAYAGKVGSGFSEHTLAELELLLMPRVVEHNPFARGKVARGVVFVEPGTSCTVEYTEWTRTRTLRHPTFKGLVR